MKLITAMLLSITAISVLPSAVRAADIPEVVRDARPVDKTVAASKVKEAHAVRAKMTAPKSRKPKDFVSLAGYDPALFDEFERLPAKRTVVSDITVCSAEGRPPIQAYQVVKGAASSAVGMLLQDYDNKEPAIEKTDSRVLYYWDSSGTTDPLGGVTQYFDYNHASAKFLSKSRGIPLRMGTLNSPQVRQPSVTTCGALADEVAILSDDVLRQVHRAGKYLFLDPSGVEWNFTASPDLGRFWMGKGPSGLSIEQGMQLFNAVVAARTARGQHPWDLVRYKVMKDGVVQMILWGANYAYVPNASEERRREESIALRLVNGKTELVWTVFSGPTSAGESEDGSGSVADAYRK